MKSEIRDLKNKSDRAEKSAAAHDLFRQYGPVGNQFAPLSGSRLQFLGGGVFIDLSCFQQKVKKELTEGGNSVIDIGEIEGGSFIVIKRPPRL